MANYYTLAMYFFYTFTYRVETSRKPVNPKKTRRRGKKEKNEWSFFVDRSDISAFDCHLEKSFLSLFGFLRFCLVGCPFFCRRSVCRLSSSDAFIFVCYCWSFLIVSCPRTSCIVHGYHWKKGEWAADPCACRREDEEEERLSSRFCRRRLGRCRANSKQSKEIIYSCAFWEKGCTSEGVFTGGSYAQKQDVSFSVFIYFVGGATMAV